MYFNNVLSFSFVMGLNEMSFIIINTINIKPPSMRKFEQIRVYCTYVIILRIEMMNLSLHASCIKP